MSLLPDETSTPDITAPNAQQATLKAFSAYDLSSVEALIRYFHAAAAFPVWYTWLKSIKAGTLICGQGSHTRIQPNTHQPAKKQSKYIWSRHDNMSGRLDKRENTSDILNLYHQKDYLTKDTTKYTSRLHTSVNYTLITRAGFQLSQERETNTSW